MIDVLKLIACVLPSAAASVLRTISRVAAPCCSTAEAIEVEISFTWPIMLPPNGFDDVIGRDLNRRNLAGDFLGRRPRLLGWALDLRSDHSKALARLT